MYNTKQQKAILNYIAENADSYITVSQISEHMKAQNIKIGLTTIYRHLDKLIEQGLINKIKVDGLSGACFKYEQPEETSYFGLKCEKCGEINKIDCSHLKLFYEHISSEHKFNINQNKTIFYGICKSCSSTTDNLAAVVSRKNKKIGD